MPIYEYQCSDCNQQFEALQSFSDDPIQVCPMCGGEQVSKLISRSSFILKGGGWYKDHYGLKSSSSGGESSSSSKASSSDSASTSGSSGSSSSTTSGD